ncbi:MAG: hypothetical protein GX131_13125 [candidate division WS1 bacterium]|jgi:hypothetical protein|nr:hypothetical protein [candidate division WS1 bacterium]
MATSSQPEAARLRKLVNRPLGFKRPVPPVPALILLLRLVAINRLIASIAHVMCGGRFVRPLSRGELLLVYVALSGSWHSVSLSSHTPDNSVERAPSLAHNKEQNHPSNRLEGLQDGVIDFGRTDERLSHHVRARVPALRDS